MAKYAKTVLVLIKIMDSNKQIGANSIQIIYFHSILLSQCTSNTFERFKCWLVTVQFDDQWKKEEDTIKSVE